MIERTSNDNKKFFDTSYHNMRVYGCLYDILFHYWFIFDEKKENIVSLIPAKEILKNINFESQSYIYNKIINMLGNKDIEEIKITDNIIYKYYLNTM